MENISLLWLRRDLRTHDSHPLYLACQQPGLILPVFIIDRDILKRFANQGDRKLSFLADSLIWLNEQLALKNGGLLILYGRAEEIIPHLAYILKIKKVFAGEEFEPELIQRDKNITRFLKEQQCELKLVNDHLIMHPNEILKDDRQPYCVFTPYSRKWKQTYNALHSSPYDINDYKRYVSITQIKAEVEKAGLKILEHNNDPKQLLNKIGSYQINYWHANQAQQRLEGFVNNKLDRYKIDRDFMAIDGTSKLSPYLRLGILSIRECYNAAVSNDTWLNELIWRDFYAMVLYHFPISAKENLKIKYRSNLQWRNNTLEFNRYCEGKTGFPIIDAAIRQLLNEGWIHNRARMIVASFLTKHLLIDWRWGEEFFAQNLLDYELSSNVGGWQWAASTGTDAVPYFRIFNPILQGRKFDPEGSYIKKYLPELKDIPGKYIHIPNSYKPHQYIEQMVDLKLARERAIALFRA